MQAVLRQAASQPFGETIVTQQVPALPRAAEGAAGPLQAYVMRAVRPGVMSRRRGCRVGARPSQFGQFRTVAITFQFAGKQPLTRCPARAGRAHISATFGWGRQDVRESWTIREKP